MLKTPLLTMCVILTHTNSMRLTTNEQQTMPKKACLSSLPILSQLGIISHNKDEKEEKERNDIKEDSESDSEEEKKEKSEKP